MRHVTFVVDDYFRDETASSQRISDLSPRPHFAVALSEWRSALGIEHVVADDGPALATANSACCGRGGGIAAILYPADEHQVRDCLAIANTGGIAVSPLSIGRNWGYGSRQPRISPGVVLSLRRLNAITDIDRAAARVRLEPGVTFGELAGRLRSDAPELLAPEIGAGPDPSVLGNALAGGIGKGPYGWMATRLTELKLAMPDGGTLLLQDLPTTGLRGANASASDGVVLQATFRLLETPALGASAWARLADGREAFADALERALSAATTCKDRQQVELLNGPRLTMQCPDLSIGSNGGVHDGWLVVFTLWGDDDRDIACRASGARDIFSSLQTVETGVTGAERVAGRLDRGRDGLASAYALTGRPPPPDADPDRDGCGVRWFGIHLPSSAPAAVMALDLLGACALAHGFAPALAVRMPDGDPVGLLGLFWTRRDSSAVVASADARAAACAAACLALARGSGLVPYRPGLDAAQTL